MNKNYIRNEKMDSVPTYEQFNASKRNHFVDRVDGRTAKAYRPARERRLANIIWGRVCWTVVSVALLLSLYIAVYNWAN